MDYVPELLEIARRRAAAEDLSIEFDEADAERLPYGDASFDVVLSAIGVMFSADHAQRRRRSWSAWPVPVAGSALASWTPEGFVGGILRTVGKHVAPPAGAQPRDPVGHRGGRRRAARRRRRRRRGRSTATVSQRFATAEDFADLFLTYYGPTYSAAGRLDEEGRAALRADLVALAQRLRPRHRDRRGPRLGVPHRHGDPPLTAHRPSRHDTEEATNMKMKSTALRTRMVLAGRRPASSWPARPRRAPPS